MWRGSLFFSKALWNCVPLGVVYEEGIAAEGDALRSSFHNRDLETKLPKFTSLNYIVGEVPPTTVYHYLFPALSCNDFSTVMHGNGFLALICSSAHWINPSLYNLFDRTPFQHQPVTRRYGFILIVILRVSKRTSQPAGCHLTPEKATQYASMRTLPYSIGPLWATFPLFPWHSPSVVRAKLRYGSSIPIPGLVVAGLKSASFSDFIC